MSLAEKIPVEPLCKERWERVEYGLLSQLAGQDPIHGPPPPERRRKAQWRSPTLVTTGAAAAVCCAVALRPTWKGTGDATTRLATGSGGSRVEVGESTLEVDPESSMRLSGDGGHGVLLVLKRGRVECDVPPRQAGPPFVVEAGPVTLRVSGTHFAVRRGTDATTVVVQRGVVDVEVGDRHVLVHAGERWPPSMSAVLR